MKATTTGQRAKALAVMFGLVGAVAALVIGLLTFGVQATVASAGGRSGGRDGRRSGRVDQGQLAC